VPWTVVAAAVVPVAVFGRPADRPITDRVTIGAKFVRLTAEMVRTAVVALGMSRVKDPGDITFPGVGIHRDGPGWLARFNLPAGVEAIAVIERRGALSSALRLPVDQVWPSVGPDHAGQVDLWVGMVPTSKMPAPKWALASESARTSVFDGYPIGHDERLRPVAFKPFERNVLIGGQPGSGKTYAGRAIVLGALLDPTVECWLAAFKPSEDFWDVRDYCTRYECGLDEATMTAGAEMVAAGLREVQRRQTLLGKLKRDGTITEGRTSPELAAAGIGLHPLLLVFDEAHELLADDDVARNAVRLVKQGRSAGVICVFITQVAGAGAIPPELTRIASSRWCLSVLDQIANDQVMGTGAYKRGLTGTSYRPGVDAGWGATLGIADGYAGACRAYYPTQRDLTTLLTRIKTVRTGTTYATDSDTAPRRDFLADVIRVFADAGRRRLHGATLAELLATAYPDAYAGLSQDVLSATMRDLGVPTEQVNVEGTNRRGFKIETVEAAVANRPEITGSE
jgi:S-DNA-T family DNA segregation ATPase FtsK/SpoIIIE